MVIPSVQDLEDRVQTQSSEVHALRAAIHRITDVYDSRIDDLGHAVSDLEAKLPELIEQSIKPKLAEMHDRVQREMQETVGQTLEIFAGRIQSRVAEKITSIENRLTPRRPRFPPVDSISPVNGKRSMIFAITP